MQTKKTSLYCWFVLAGCVLIMALAYAPRVSCASLFVRPITEDMGFSRSAYTLTGTITSLMCMVLSPVMGKLMSGKRMHLTLCICVGGVALAYGAYGFARNLIQFYIVAFFVGLFAMGACTIPVSVVITNWFEKKRGFAMSIAMAGISVGGFAISPVIGYLLTLVGWRQTYFILGAAMFIILVPIALLVIRRAPSDKGLLPYGATEESVAAQKSGTGAAKWSISLTQAKGMMAFWVFLFGATSIMLTGGILGHIPAYIQDSGYAVAVASSFVSLFSLVAIFGKLVLGHVFDKFGPVAGVLFGNLTFALSLACLLFLQIRPMLYLAAVLYGFGTCIATVTVPVLTSRIFGTRHYSEIYGFVSMFTMLGGAFGTPLAGVCYDVTGSYRLALLLFIALSVIMTLALLVSIRSSQRKQAMAMATAEA